MKNIILAISVLFLISINDLVPQKNNFDKSQLYSYGNILFYDHLILPENIKDSGEVFVFFKILYDALIFNKVNPTEYPGEFQAIPELEIVYYDSQNIIRSRILWRDTIYAKNFEETKSKSKYTYGIVYNKLRNDKYRFTIQLLTKSKQYSEIKESKLELKDFNIYDSKVTFGNILNIENETLFKPIIWNGNINFSSKDIQFITLINNIDENVEYKFNLKKIKSTNINFIDENVDINGKLEILKNKTFANISSSKEITFKIVDNNNEEILILKGDIPSQNLSTGTYELKITNNINLDSITYQFEVRWIDMPLSLQDINYATRAMYYILTDEEYNNLRKGNTNEMIKKLSDYWKNNDPTPLTPFNEALDQYFKRVDYAFFNFQTIREQDGTFTDRGKIYILFGPPDSVENKFINQRSQEIWQYKRLNKTFIFEIDDNGRFVLKSIEG